MARTAIGAAFLSVTAAVVIGCGPAKELPDETPVTDSATAQPVIPTTSQPAAQAAVKKAIDAFTGGKPELLAKGKVSRVTAKGITVLDPTSGAGGQVNAVRRVQAVWPDRGSVVYDLKGEQNVTISTYLRRPFIRVFTGDIEKPSRNPGEEEKIMAFDLMGQHWLMMLLPATDPKAIVFDQRSVTVAGQPATTISLALPDFPVYQLTFDAKTDALIQVDYTHRALGNPISKRMTLKDHQRGPDGLFLPGAATYSELNQMRENWVLENWEFPPTIDDKEFSPPEAPPKK